MTRFNALLDTLRLPASRPYSPDFHVKTQKDGFLLLDGPRELARFYPTCMDIWAFGPFEPDILFNPQSPDHVVDLHTLRNTTVNLGTQIWPRHWLSVPSAMDQLRWTWLVDHGAKLVAQVDMPGPEGESGQWIITLDYDPARGQYRWRLEVSVRKLDPAPMEFFNLMMAGALVDRAELRRWSHSVWENPDGKLRRVVHSNALLAGTEYTGDRDERGPWRSRNLPYPQAWFGYAAHERFNPFVFVHASDAPLWIGTCNALFDEHLLWSTAGQDNLGEDGYFHTSASLELVNLPPDAARALLDQATDPIQPQKWRAKKIILPFWVDRVTDFETEVPLWEPVSSPILILSPDADSPIAWAADQGRGGGKAIRFRGQANARQDLHPCCAVCMVEAGRRYKLRGHIRTQGVTHHARLELASFEYTFNNIIDVACSRNVTGDTDWTCVEADLLVGRQRYVLPKMVLQGQGMAWFDDLELLPV
ncbi:MAG: hypothetical protein IT440_11645 [Phycisphaeraceae bacterium]|nr:hypothetical protein [Phycisphaeraceae bacterium]